MEQSSMIQTQREMKNAIKWTFLLRFQEDTKELSRKKTGKCPWKVDPNQSFIDRHFVKHIFSHKIKLMIKLVRNKTSVFL
jgi:hypothetical protein